MEQLDFGLISGNLMSKYKENLFQFQKYRNYDKARSLKACVKPLFINMGYYHIELSPGLKQLCKIFFP